MVDVPARKAQTVGELEAEVRALRKELRETKRANEILKAADNRCVTKASLQSAALVWNDGTSGY